jgi:flagellar protein FlgJ
MRLNLNIPLPLSEASVRAQVELRGMPGGRREIAQDGRLEKVMQDFESVLLEQMLKEMRNTVPESPLFGKNPGREIFNELLDGEFARSIENRGGIGLANFMLARMKDQ